MANTKSKPESRVMSVENFCALLGIGSTKAFEIIKEHRVKSLKIGRRRLILVESVDAFIADALAREAE